ncbi:MAG: phospholipid carrier-dependent glycosyltransferase, partial [Anaerolineales bacterium]|nr:phospholipid carrier-dependent glycosyltransferase [Anaerolineales bacterium]
MKRSNLLQKYDWGLPLLLFVIFVAITTPGIAHVWNPDELVHRVGNALEGRWQFDQTNFDYPSLPKYVMLGVGKLMEVTGVAQFDFPTAARFVTVLLGGLIVALTYTLTRKLGGGIGAAVIAALLTLSSSEFAINARFAHNDLYLIFFLLLTVFALVRYRLSTSRLWLYAAFIFVGMAVSSKYNGISMIALPVLVFLLDNHKEIRKNALPALETLFIGGILVFFGYAIGTPKA